MLPTEIPIYRPEITVYRRAMDGEWETVHGGAMTNTLFYPMPDEDRLTEAGFRRVVRLGAEPFFRVLISEGATLIEIGRATFLAMPDGKKLDATTALACAKMRDKGLDLVRAARSPDPVLRPVELPKPKGPARQLSMFDMEAACA